MQQKYFFLPTLLLLGVTLKCTASPVIIEHTFTSGTPAVAAHVNENFAAIKTAVDDNDSRLAALEVLITNFQSQLVAANTQITQLQSQLTTANAEITQLQNELTTINNNSVLDLDGYLTLETDAASNPVATFAAVNVNIVNGQNRTDTINGLGNLTVGYNELKTYGTFICSNAQFNNQQTCEANGDTWSRNHRTGSHNLIVGARNSYSNYGGFVAGEINAVTGRYSSVSGGAGGLASGNSASVSGGSNNTANGTVSSVSGGISNTASGYRSSVSGGGNNSANAPTSSISGGGNRSIDTTQDYWWTAGNYSDDNLPN